jgi:drug/metabolite transporter (DMT)-like permease
MVIVWWFALVATLGAIPLAAPDFVMPRAHEWLVLLGVGVFTHLGQWTLTHSLVRERAGRAMSVGYLQIVFAAIWGILFFAEIPDPLGIAGALLIVGSIIAIGQDAE